MYVPPTLTQLLESAGRGDAAALNAVVASLYDELLVLARAQRRRWQGNHTLDTTALVHETYLKLARQKRIEASGRAHFLALASRAMRHVLSNYAEQRRTQKRGGDQAVLSLRELDRAFGNGVDHEDDAMDTLLAVQQALAELEAVDARACRVVECRFFGGMSVEDTAAALGIAPRTVNRDWAYAQAWLLRALGRRAAR